MPASTYPRTASGRYDIVRVEISPCSRGIPRTLLAVEANAEVRTWVGVAAVAVVAQQALTFGIQFVAMLAGPVRAWTGARLRAANG
jgi:hypothetical protein